MAFKKKRGKFFYKEGTTFYYDRKYFTDTTGKLQLIELYVKYCNAFDLQATYDHYSEKKWLRYCKETTASSRKKMELD